MKYMLHGGIHKENELSYLAELTVHSISPTHQHCHAKLSPIALHGNPRREWTRNSQIFAQFQILMRIPAKSPLDNTSSDCWNQ